MKVTELLTKQDFEKVALTLDGGRKAIDSLRVSHDLGSRQLNNVFDSMVKDIAEVLTKTNPRFNIKKFKEKANGLA